MSTIKVEYGESFEKVLRRSGRQVERDGVLKETRRREHYGEREDKG